MGAKRSIKRAAGPVLVYMPDRGVGDLMWHLPTIRAIAATTPEGKVVLATRPTTRAGDLLSVEPRVACVEYLEYRKGAFKRPAETWDFFRLCRRLRPRAVWILEKIGRPAFAAWLAGVPERRGLGMGHGQERWLSPGPRLSRAMRPAHRIDKLAAFETLHGLTVTSREPALLVDPRLREEVRARFAVAPRPWTVFGVGASEAVKCWPLDRFASIAAAMEGTAFWLGGFPDSDAVEAARQGKGVNVCDLQLGAGAALIAEAALFVGNDSGPLNLAAAVGTPAVGLFGPTPPLTYSRWITSPASPPADLKDLTVEAVLDAVRAAGPR